MPIPQPRILMSFLLKQLSDSKSYSTHTLVEILAKEFSVTNQDLKNLENRVKEIIQDLKERGLIDSDGDTVKISDLGLQTVEEREDMRPEEELVDEE